jgi:hypothetical protein
MDYLEVAQDQFSMVIFSVLGLRLRCHNVELHDLSPLELGIPAMLELDVLMKVSTVAIVPIRSA